MERVHEGLVRRKSKHSEGSDFQYVQRWPIHPVRIWRRGEGIARYAHNSKLKYDETTHDGKRG